MLKAVAPASLALVFGLMVPGLASAQYWNGYGYDYYADPGDGGGTAYYPFYYPYGDRPRPAIPRNHGAGYDQGSAQSPYVEPYSGGRDPYGDGRDVRSGGGYDLGPNASRTTREEVPNTTHQPPGTIVVDTTTRHLYYTQPNGEALRYGIGVGRQGFAWKGVAKIERKAEWPGWTPPSDMLKRRPDLPLHMEGGIDNPLGARALYLFQGNRDTMFRIHGTNEPDTIGQAVSSGCIRMMNADVIDLYRRVPVGTRVVVL